jgi:hypothetical protein
MKYRSFFDEVEKVVLKDELCQFVGVNDDGIVEFSYLDLVKTAGHSCLVVSGAYLMALKGLKALFPDELPKRGEIKVEISKSPTDDNAGVVGSVLSNITGATTDYGFGGFPNGRFNRRNTLIYNAPIETFIKLTRLDTNEQVGINYNPSIVGSPREELKKAIAPGATQEDVKNFGEVFQSMVKSVFENSDKVIKIIKY